MSTITLPNIRVSSDLTVSVRLKDNGVAIDWSTLNNVKASIYSDAQRALAGRCDVSVDAEDPTVLVCQYAANKPQYVGVCRIVVSAKYMGETKTYDKPAFNFVRWTADQDGEQITIDDPDVDVEIEVSDVSSALLDEAIRAAFTAAEEAVDAKGQVLETEAEVEAAEALRVSAEESRVEAEEGRAEAEAARVDEEAVRVSAEDARVVAENARAAAEDLREGAEDDRAAAETARETAEAARVAAEALRVTAEGSRETAEAAREAQASADHTVAAGDHTQAAADHTQAAADHTTAASDHTLAGADHTLAAADHVTAGEDHAQAQDDHEVMAGYDTRLWNVEGEVSQLEAKVTDLYIGLKPLAWVEKSYYDASGVIRLNASYSSCLAKIRDGGTKIITNCKSSSGYIVFFDENDAVVGSPISKTTDAILEYNIPTGAVKVGLTNQNSYANPFCLGVEYQADLSTIASVSAACDNNSSQIGVLADVVKSLYDIPWTANTYFYMDGSVHPYPGIQSALITLSGDFVLTNINTKNNNGQGYVVFFGENDSVLSYITKNNDNLELIKVPTGTIKVGLTHSSSGNPAIVLGGDNYLFNQTTLNETLQSLSEETEQGKLAFDAFMTPISWERGKNYNAQGTIDNNYQWECALVNAGLKQITFNFFLGAAKLVFFDSNDSVISTYGPKNNNSFVTLDVPDGCKTIGLSNNWVEQADPQITGIGISRTIPQIDADIAYLNGKLSNLDPVVIYSAIGDSISSDEVGVHADSLAYPRTLAKLLNATLDRHTVPGTGIMGQLANYASQVDGNADLVTVLYGINDFPNIANGTTPIGDLSEIMAYALDDIPQDTIMGVYRKSLETLKNRLKPNALICCISPVSHLYYDNPSAIHYNPLLQQFRDTIKEFTRLEGGANNGWFYIDGTKIGLTYNDAIYYVDDNSPNGDSTHPNIEGEAIMAKHIFDYLPNIYLYVNRK